MAQVRLAVAGSSGRMGRALVEAVLGASDLKLVAALEQKGNAHVGKDAGEVVTGAPFVDGAKVVGVIDRTDKSKKIRVFKKKRRKQYRRTQGHRSLLTRVRITDIQA